MVARQPQRPLEVLHVYSGNLFGGIETLLLTLARRRAEEPGMVPSFALCFDGRLSEELEKLNVSRFRLPETRVSRPWHVWRARRALRDLLASRHFDVVICHSVWTQAIFGSQIKKSGIQQAFWLHDAAATGHWLEKWASLTKPDKAVCNSQYVAGTMKSLFPEALSAIIRYPVESASAMEAIDPTRRAQVRHEATTPSDAVVIIQHCRLEEWKGHRDLIEALGHLADLPGWIYWQVGGAQRKHEKEYLNELQNRARELGIFERIRFLGQRKDVPELLRAADIHCQPNPSPEPFGISFIEALYARLPVVSTAIGGAAEIITDRCGVLVSPRDPKPLAAELRKLILDESLRQKLGAAGPERASEICDPKQQLVALAAFLRLDAHHQ